MSQDESKGASQHWHTESVDRVAVLCDTDLRTGLTALEAGRRRAANIEPVRREGHAPWLIFFRQFWEFMILVLIVAAGVSAWVGEVEDAFVILAIVLLNAVIGFIQEFRAQRALEALRKLSPEFARVIRDGSEVAIPAAELVPGDLLLIEAGEKISADARLVEQNQFKTDESALTGESLPVEKQVEGIQDPKAGLAERLNLVFRGTVAVNGRARAIVFAVGRHTELGKISDLLEKTETQRTPLQLRLHELGKRLSFGAIAICIVVFFFGIYRGGDLTQTFLVAISLAVAAIPESLPAVVTVALAIGASRMARLSALVRRLPAVETLGSITTICSDKTGTLTMNRMKVDSIWCSDLSRAELLLAMALNNDATSTRDGGFAGDPVEVALLAFTASEGLDLERTSREMPRISEIPFDSERKRMSTQHQRGTEYWSFTKGAPEMIVERCRLDDAQKALILGKVEEMAAKGLRVIAFSRKKIALSGDHPSHEHESGMEFLGLAGIEDPPRTEALDAVRTCRAAGIVPVMITGDHAATARAIASRLEILDEGALVLTGRELAAMSDEEFQGRVKDIRVYARMSPEQKIRVVSALQAKGEVVAMTGDGVNDAPALKKADIGVAMGKQGTDVAREASQLVLLDDHFATIVSAVREGRRIYENIRKFVKFATTGNFGEVLTVFMGPWVGIPMPLLATQILWVNLVTDGLPGIALSLEPSEKEIMNRPPRPMGQSVFAEGIWQHILIVGALIGGVSLGAGLWISQSRPEAAQTAIFTVLACSQMFHVLAVRSESVPFFSPAVFRNPWLVFAAFLTLMLQAAVIYLAPFNKVFSTVPLEASEVVTCLLLSMVVGLVVEFEKFAVGRGWLYRRSKSAII